MIAWPDGLTVPLVVSVVLFTQKIHDVFVHGSNECLSKNTLLWNDPYNQSVGPLVLSFLLARR